MSDMLSQLSELQDLVKAASGKAWSKFDKLTYGMLVECLKGADAEATRDALEQLAREKRPSAIPPVYLVSQAHPNPWVKEQAKKALAKLVDEKELNNLTGGKDLKSAMQALIGHYGNFRS